MAQSDRTLSNDPPADPSRPPNFDALIAEGEDDVGDTPTPASRSTTIDDDDSPRGVGGIPAREDADDAIEVVEPTEEEKREARKIGWREKREFRGDPNNWVDARTYLKRGREVLPIVKSQNERLEAENAKLRQEMDEIKEAAKSYTAFVDEQKKLQRDYELSSLKGARADALREQDMDKVNEIDLRLQELRTAPIVAPKKTDPEPVTPDPETLRLWAENVRAYPALADKAAQEDWGSEALRLRLSGNRDTGQDFVDRVNDRMRRLYPERYERRPAMVDGDGSPGPGNGNGSSEKSWDNLRPAYKREYEKSGKRLGISRKEFLANCDESCFER